MSAIADKIAALEPMGMNLEIASLGLEREELGRAFGNAQIGGFRIPYEPKQLSGLITTIRPHNPRRYLAIEGVSLGGAEYIAHCCKIPSFHAISPDDNEKDIRRQLRATPKAEPFDLISIDARGLPLTVAEIWKYIVGGKEPVTEFGKGAATDYGPTKLKPGTLVIFNFASPQVKDLYFTVRTMDNKMHQSTFAGMVKV